MIDYQTPKPGDIARLVMARRALRTLAREFHTCQYSGARCPGCFAASYVREMRAHERAERDNAEANRYDHDQAIEAQANDL